MHNYYYNINAQLKSTKKNKKIKNLEAEINVSDA